MVAAIGTLPADLRVPLLLAQARGLGEEIDRRSPTVAGEYREQLALDLA